MLIVAYHSAVPPDGLVLGGRQGEGPLYARGAGYDYATEWIGNYTVTGTFAGWALEAGYIALDVELPDHEHPASVPQGDAWSHLEVNIDALLLLLWDDCRWAAPGCV